MKEIKQHHVTWITLFNTLIIMGIIAFFYRKYLEFTKREDELNQRTDRLEKKMNESDKYHKAVMARITKKMSEGMMVQPLPHMVPRSIEEEFEPDDRNDIENALASLLA